MEFFGIQPSLLRGLAEKSHYKEEIHNWLKLILDWPDVCLLDVLFKSFISMSLSYYWKSFSAIVKRAVTIHAQRYVHDPFC